MKTTLLLSTNRSAAVTAAAMFHVASARAEAAGFVGLRCCARGRAHSEREDA